MIVNLLLMICLVLTQSKFSRDLEENDFRHGHHEFVENNLGTVFFLSSEPNIVCLRYDCVSALELKPDVMCAQSN